MNLKGSKLFLLALICMSIFQAQAIRPLTALLGSVGIGGTLGLLFYKIEGDRADYGYSDAYKESWKSKTKKATCVIGGIGSAIAGYFLYQLTPGPKLQQARNIANRVARDR